MSQVLFRFTEVPDHDGLTLNLDAWFVEYRHWSWWRGHHWRLWAHKSPYGHEPRYFASLKQAQVAANAWFNSED